MVWWSGGSWSDYIQCYFNPYDFHYGVRFHDIKSDDTTIREQFKSRQDITLTLLQKALSDVEQELARAVAENERVQSETQIFKNESVMVGATITNARLAVVGAYEEHGISQGRAGAIFRFTDSGEDAITYNISLAAMNSQAEANLSSFNTSLNEIMTTLHAEVQAAKAQRISALAKVEDARFESAFPANVKRLEDIESGEDRRNLRNRIRMSDILLMATGWGGIWHINTWDDPFPHDPRYACPLDIDRTGSFTDIETIDNIGRAEYIHKYWDKEQILERTYTRERLDAVDRVLDNLERALQDRIDYWKSQWEADESENIVRYIEQCELSLIGVRDKRQAIVAENPVPTD